MGDLEVIALNEKFPINITTNVALTMEDNSFSLYFKYDDIEPSEIEAFSENEITLRYGSCLNDEGQFFLIDIPGLTENCEIHFSINEACISLDRYTKANEGQGYSFKMYLIDGKNILKSMRVIVASSTFSNAILNGMQNQYRYTYTHVEQLEYINKIRKFQSLVRTYELSRFVKETYISGTIS